MGRGAICAGVILGIGLTTPPASAQGLFDTLLRGVFGSPPRATPVPRDPAAPGLRLTVPGGPGSGTAHCVRLCDGAHFPLPQLASPRMTPARLCKTLCPAAQTRIYWGNDIAQAVTAGGGRYADLAIAFAYRDRLVPGCTCNGRTPFGTAAISLQADITLQPGDIVATEQGLRVYHGTREGRDPRIASAPVADATALPAPLRRQLAATPVRSPRQAVPPPPIDFDARIVFDAAPLAGGLTTPKADQGPLRIEVRPQSRAR